MELLNIGGKTDSPEDCKPDFHKMWLNHTKYVRISPYKILEIYFEETFLICSLSSKRDLKHKAIDSKLKDWKDREWSPALEIHVYVYP